MKKRCQTYFAGSAYNAIGRIVTGGTLSEATGGKFKNGAQAAAFAIVVGGVVEGVQVWKGSASRYAHIEVMKDGSYDITAATGEGIIFVNGLNNEWEVALLKGAEQLEGGATRKRCQTYFAKPHSIRTSRTGAKQVGQQIGLTLLSNRRIQTILEIGATYGEQCN